VIDMWARTSEVGLTGTSPGDRRKCPDDNSLNGLAFEARLEVFQFQRGEVLQARDTGFDSKLRQMPLHTSRLIQ
jgi:hypothetical protein